MQASEIKNGDAVEFVIRVPCCLGRLGGLRSRWDLFDTSTAVSEPVNLDGLASSEPPNRHLEPLKTFEAPTASWWSHCHGTASVTARTTLPLPRRDVGSAGRREWRVNVALVLVDAKVLDVRSVEFTTANGGEPMGNDAPFTCMAPNETAWRAAGEAGLFRVSTWMGNHNLGVGNNMWLLQSMLGVAERSGTRLVLRRPQLAMLDEIFVLPWRCFDVIDFDVSAQFFVLHEASYMTHTRFNFVRCMCGACLVHVWDLCGACVLHASRMCAPSYAICMLHVCSMYVENVLHICYMYVACMLHVCCMYAACRTHACACCMYVACTLQVWCLCVARMLHVFAGVGRPAVSGQIPSPFRSITSA